jgi:DNA invertase Pin-like site-specific DNA recombinase
MSNQNKRIQKKHLDRQAVVYIRQSTTKQLRENKESTRLQLGLCKKAMELGWPKPIVIDEDLGVSASGYAFRPGFQKLLTHVSLKKVGTIFCFDASRLSRNSKDWAQLMELCGYFGTLIADFDNLYDLSQYDDRLIFGIKGTLAASELTMLRQRMLIGRRAKAERGELKMQFPAGYCYDLAKKIVFDPNERVQQAIRLMFSKFEQIGSIRQLIKWYRDEKRQFPIREFKNGAWTQVWKIPKYTTLRNLLKHACYTGAYVWGKTETEIEYQDGQLVKKVKCLKKSNWKAIRSMGFFSSLYHGL